MARSNASSSPVARARKPAMEPAAAKRDDQDSAAMASYIADMASELAQLANYSDMPMVAYFLNLARAEAEGLSREMGGVAIERSEQ